MFTLAREWKNPVILYQSGQTLIVEVIHGKMEIMIVIILSYELMEYP